MTNEEARLSLVTTLTATIIINEGLDELKETDFYQKNKQLKLTGKQFEAQITKACKKQIDNMWNYKEKEASNLTEAIRSIGEHVANLTPNEIVGLSKRLTIKKY